MRPKCRPFKNCDFCYILLLARFYYVTSGIDTRFSMLQDMAKDGVLGLTSRTTSVTGYNWCVNTAQLNQCPLMQHLSPSSDF